MFQLSVSTPLPLSRSSVWSVLCIFLISLSFCGSYNIDVHDYSVRLKAAQKFLKDGDKVTCLFAWWNQVQLSIMYKHLLFTCTEILIPSLQVKIIVNLKGRENEFRNNAIELIRRFQNDVGEVHQAITSIVKLSSCCWSFCIDFEVSWILAL